MGITGMFLDFMRFMVRNRRGAVEPVTEERRKHLFPINCKDANRKLAESVDRLNDAVTRAVERRK